ncbi:MAG: protocatechuate 3,4-dioxygenase [Acidobacteriota bacterium]|nr:protocatechuate 3,4-dioxygenase [Acidobacteriota bacterium]
MRDHNQILPRRSFLKHASAFAVALPLVEVGTLSLFGCSPATSAEQKAVAPRAENVPAKIVIVSDKEPGEPLIVSGVIVAPDGRTPLEGIKLYVYQTDATGVYSTAGNGGDNRNTRIHGVMRTGADGRYEFRTIKPASYPNSRISAHIHAHLSGADYPEYWIDEYNFADDPLVTEDVKRRFASLGSFSPVLTLTRGSDGVWRGVRDIKVERCTNNCVRH